MANDVLNIKLEMCSIHRPLVVQMVDEGKIVAPNSRYGAAFAHLKLLDNPSTNPETLNYFVPVVVGPPKLIMSWKDADPLTPRVFVSVMITLILKFTKKSA